jgi:hypothetical protein
VGYLDLRMRGGLNSMHCMQGAAAMQVLVPCAHVQHGREPAPAAKRTVGCAREPGSPPDTCAAAADPAYLAPRGRGRRVVASCI